MLCVVVADRNAGVAALAQGPEISRVVGTPVCMRKDVVHFLCGRQPTFALTLLTQRMRLDVACTYPSPCATVTLVGVGIALVFVILAPGDLPVFFAVPPVGQPAATGIGAGALWFVGHLLTFYRL